MSRKRKRRPRTPAAKKSPASGTAREAASQPQPAPTQRRRRADERPPAPWGNAPLAELVILGGIVSLAYGIIGLPIGLCGGAVLAFSGKLVSWRIVTPRAFQVASEAMNRFTHTPESSWL